MFNQEMLGNTDTLAIHQICLRAHINRKLRISHLFTGQLIHHETPQQDMVEVLALVVS